MRFRRSDGLMARALWVAVPAAAPIAPMEPEAPHEAAPAADPVELVLAPTVARIGGTGRTTSRS